MLLVCKSVSLLILTIYEDISKLEILPGLSSIPPAAEPYANKMATRVCHESSATPFDFLVAPTRRETKRWLSSKVVIFPVNWMTNVQKLR